VKRVSKVVGFMIAVFSLLVAVPFAQAAHAPGALPAKANFQGKSYAEWSQLWWQWAAAMPKGQSALDDTTGARCQLGSMGNVFFLAGVAGTTEGNPSAPTAERSCTIQTGTAVFAPLLNVEASIDEGNGDTEAELAAVAESVIDDVTVANTTATLDDRSLAPVRTFATDLFPIDFAADNPFGIPVDQTDPTFAVADGYYVLIPLLPVGEHTLRLTGDYLNGTFTVNVLYHLTVAHPGG